MTFSSSCSSSQSRFHCLRIELGKMNAKMSQGHSSPPVLDAETAMFEDVHDQLGSGVIPAQNQQVMQAIT